MPFSSNTRDLVARALRVVRLQKKFARLGSDDDNYEIFIACQPKVIDGKKRLTRSAYSSYVRGENYEVDI